MEITGVNYEESKSILNDIITKWYRNKDVFLIEQIGELLLYLGHEETTKEDAELYFLNGKQWISREEFVQNYIKFEAYNRIIEVFEKSSTDGCISVRDAKMSLNFCGQQVKIDYDKFNTIVGAK